MSRHVLITGVTAIAVVANIGAVAEAQQADQGKRPPAGVPTFVMHRVGTFRSEACGVGDFNNDGKPDIVAGPYVYLAPDWKPVKIRELKGSVNEKGIGYYDDFANVPLDVDGDGWLDVVSCAWMGGCCTWYRNPGKAGGGLWRETLIERHGNFEGGELWDVDGDGKALELVPNGRHTEWFELGKLPDGHRGFIQHIVSQRRPAQVGSGAGDVNGDGRLDIIRPDAWYEAPADPRGGKWIEHPLSLGGKDGKLADTAQIFVYDVNGDGLNDIICSSAHRYGVFWYEQVRHGAEITWKQHVIDDTWSQAHSLMLADINGDGIPEIITGKRFMAHCGTDPGEFDPLGVYWYQLKPGSKPVWTKHVISYNEGIGAGGNIVVADLNGDGNPDIVVTGKYGGPVWFENQLRRVHPK
jgi:hypothetical protein